MPDIVKLKNVTKRFGTVTVLNEFDLAIEDGEFVVLLGPSGCGKSTLLRLIAGLEPASSGEIWINNRRVDQLPPRLRNIAMVFQSYALYAHLDVARNIAFPLKMRNWRWWYEIPLLGRLFPRRRSLDKSFQHKAVEAAKVVGLEQLLDRKPRQLSGGQRQRVAVARAIVSDPAVFLMDEPLSNLDAQLRSQTRAEIMQLYRRLGRTFLYVTHDQVEAMTMGSRVILLDRGVIQQDGAPQELFERPANVFVARFLGSPPMNIAEARVTPQGFALGDALVGSVDAAKEFRSLGVERVSLGIRPEHIGISDTGVPATIDLVERLGTEQILSVTMAGHRWQIRLSMDVAYEVGQVVKLAMDPARLHFFDYKTGQRL
ncbi:ABC transporter ATP-binding protein [Mesorhizobium sp. ANAO-SY3R2]|uniref:ABC transporter ATP-binding protein n=1 Tax=Mesorhizobium sp. ANAO-SY3R2 TaxID=3166644 RepID=UPI0036711172